MSWHAARRASSLEESGPAQEKLRDYLRHHHPPLPGLLRVCLVLSGLAFAALAACVAFGFMKDTHTGVLLIEFIGIMTISGPQSAALFVFTAAKPPLSLAWVLTVSLLNMAATLFLIVPLVYRGFERLRDNRIVGGLLLSTEQFSIKHRKFLARWGLLGLILVALAPIQGGGVLGAGILGVLLRIPLRRLLLVVVVAGTVMTVGWIFLIKFFSAGLPTHGVYGLLPYAVVVAFLAAGGYGSWRSHRHRFQYQVETLPGTPDAQIIRLKEIGIQEDDHVLKANLATLCRKLGIARKDLSRARHTAELLRLDNLDPSAAERLTAVGIVSIRELAMAPVQLVREALKESHETTWELPSTRLIESWKDAAKAFESQVRRQTKTTH